MACVTAFGKSPQMELIAHTLLEPTPSGGIAQPSPLVSDDTVRWTAKPHPNFAGNVINLKQKPLVAGHALS